MTIDPALPFSPFSALHHDASYDALAGRVEVGWDAFLTCNVSVDRRLLDEAGGFDPRLTWHEDIELGERLARRGMHLFYAPEALAYHHHLLDEAAYLRIAEREGAAWCCGTASVRTWSPTSPGWASSARRRSPPRRAIGSPIWRCRPPFCPAGRWRRGL